MVIVVTIGSDLVTTASLLNYIKHLLENNIAGCNLILKPSVDISLYSTQIVIIPNCFLIIVLLFRIVLNEITNSNDQNLKYTSPIYERGKTFNSKIYL